ncbi:Tectonic-3 [Araneus ventricosus]|uniref:Tectonic-3 n=1 Tax=Araneus ventricosus TaxID=182803 RepID=A0A4Y2AE95_ARAVE|nr:Tectonic-3 [Araneus ventricosus]
MLLRTVKLSHGMTTKSLFKIFFIIYINCILFYVKTADLSENISEDAFNYSEYFNERTEIVDFNQSLDLFNVTSNITLSNLTDENNSSHSDLVVTEEEKTDVNQNYLSFTTSDEDICSCDLNANVCDINCCCDADCSEEDIKVFSRCHFQPLVPDPNYCYQKDIIFRNNTVYKMQKDPESSLFCIIHDNLKRHLQFKELPTIKSHRDLDLLLKYQSKYINSWTDDQKPVESVFKEMKAGSPLYIDSTSEEFKISKISWSLPSSCFTRMCSCSHEIKYLEDFDSFCSRQIHNLKDECEKNKYFSAESYSNFCIKSGSILQDFHTRLKDLISHTKEMNSDNELYQQANSLCVRNSPFKPKYLVQKNICSQVVRSVYFTVIHNGFSGIHNINVYFEYTDLDTQTEAFLQHFSVIFKWNNITNTRKRSGNPGYQVGLPILVGTNTTAIELDDTFEIQIESNGLSVLDKDENSLCSNNRRSVKFGKNLKTSCIFTFSKLNCKDLQEQIENILLGSTKKKVFIGVFGNANESNIDDWIEAYHEYSEISHSNKSCPVTTDLRINVVYAAVGTVVNPQFKILGVGYHYEKPEMVNLPCSPCPSLKLSTSVSFFDVTEPAIPHYPKVPSIKANLPNDFFYPFLYGTGIKHTYNINLVIFLFISLLAI